MSTVSNFPMRMMFTSICLGGLVATASALIPGTASAQQLRWCANEGGTCRLPYPAQVVFGAQGYTTSRSFDRPAVPCSNRVFGDPAPGLHKACYIVMRGGGGYDGGGDGDNYEPRRRGWVACADESDYCDFNGRGTVRYGARGQYTVGVFRDGVQCDNDTFGEDPAPGLRKRCYVRQ
ncbi:hypothetical protein [Mesorhizobium sp.]|uniref:hypothetical protein n=1 Tax=Mesorhizobium sp. TaxID=1871066 RepID=UPI00345750C7